MTVRHDPVWSSGPVQAAIDAGDLGKIVRALRISNHLTLAQLAARCGYSAATLSRMETGKQPLRDIIVLRNLARALGVPPTVLGLADTPRRSGPASRPATRVGPILAPDEETDPMRRRTLLAGLTGIAGSALLTPPAHGAAAAGEPVGLLEHALLDPPVPSGPPATLPQLRRAVATARSTFQHGHYAQVAAMLPDLLSTAMATHAGRTTGDDVATANGQLSDLYSLTAELMIKLGNDHLAWTAADRAVQAGHASHDILTQATARRVWAIVLRRAGCAEMAQRLVVDTATTLQPLLRQGSDHLSVYGSLLATAAYTAAGDGDRNTAHALIDEAVDAARALGADANHRFTTFGPTRVRAYQIGIARVLGDYGTAIEHARQINHANIPFAERRARYWADVARSYHGWNKAEQCFRALLAAEHAAPDEVRYRKPIQRITTDLLHHPTANKLPGLRAFANRTGTLI